VGSLLLHRPGCRNKAALRAREVWKDELISPGLETQAMEIRFYHVDVFTSRVFGGNPAVVCLLQKWLPEELMQAIAAENRVSETAFVLTDRQPYPLRWFTPTREVELCGHATVATAYVLCELARIVAADELSFTTRSGELIVKRRGWDFWLRLPVWEPAHWDPPARLLQAVGGEPLETLRAHYAVFVYENQREIELLVPDYRLMQSLDAPPVVATAPGNDVDYVFRFFAPAWGIDEDPATGSAHAVLVPFWARRRCKWWLRARQLSNRGGEFQCEYRDNHVWVCGSVRLYAEGLIHLP